MRFQAPQSPPEEVRGVLREDEKSGYNALAEEMEEQEEDPFNEIEGGSGNPQNPFNQDEWKEDDHPRNTGGKFSTSNTKGSVEKSSLIDKIKKKERKALELPKDEYSKVIHELNTNLPKELKNKPVFYRAIDSLEYKVINKGFNEYKIIEKRGINDIYD